ncbi:A/G-specific adenine glycosylase, partial [Bordetella pertussis]|uniref:A/G-specific adenine glycosylase n=1 Tax=Bordetella pertussis TaxID=520 RepID=UPI00070DE50E
MAPMDFASRITAWQARHGRHDLPWQNTRDPYRIWLSEIMLQQTQVATVIPYYQRFLERFPDVAALAAARQEDVMPYWAGLGYYARARNLHRCAQEIMQRCVGRFPPRAEEIATLPGIGRSTAAAIAAFAYGERSPIMDGNVKRVFTRHFGIEGDPARRAVEQQLWALAAAQVQAAPDLDMPGYTQGLMDLGATLCTRGKPACERCPVAQSCIARRDGRQAELPTPKARKAIPERSTAMLVLHGPDGILLHLHVRPWYLAVRGAALRQAATPERWVSPAEL